MFPSGVDLDDDGVIGELRGSVKNSAAGPGRSASMPKVGYGGELADLSGAVMRSGNAWRMHPRNWTTDRDDTIAEAQLAAARVLIEGLGPRRNRIGVVTYTTRARVRRDLGTAGEALEAIEKIRANGSVPNTSVAAALRQSRLLLTKEADPTGERQQAVLLFTDGRPTFPAGEDLARI